MTLDLDIPRWVADLRSGRFKQAQGTLKRQTATGDGHCCLGVLAETQLSWAGYSNGRFHRPPGIIDFDSSIPPDIREIIGMSDAMLDACITRNDTDGFSFAQIADWLEQEFVIPGRSGREWVDPNFVSAGTGGF